jgi:hypothetical protein
MRKVSYSEDVPPPQWQDCTEPLCHQGGADLWAVMRAAVREHKSEHQQHMPCRGSRGSPKSKHYDGPCNRLFVVSLRVQYREP